MTLALIYILHVNHILVLTSVWQAAHPPTLLGQYFGYIFVLFHISYLAIHIYSLHVLHWLFEHFDSIVHAF